MKKKRKPPSFSRRTHSIYRHQKERAAKFGVALPYSIAEYREAVARDLASGLCRYCSRRVSHATYQSDHTTPLARGGSWDLANVASDVCADCNAAKGPLTGTEFMTLLVLLAGFPESARKNTLARLKLGHRARFRAEANDDVT